MKGLILAGGTGSRLYPLTKITNKHLLPIGQKPMLFHSVEKLVEAGITDILIVTGVEHMGDIVRSLGSGKEFGCAFTYRVQDEAGGIAQALGLAKSFCGHEKFVVILGDNIFQDSLVSYVNTFESQPSGCRLLLTEVFDPQRFGVAEIFGDRIVSIEEKPKAPKSSFAVTGIYFYDEAAFEFVENCVPSGRGELEVTDVNNAYVQAGTCQFDVLTGWWTDAGTFASLQRANELVSELGS
ncbi:MAG: spore coat protein [Candidatus Margulisbacteria bacterium]|nr:spore coat protein [Candidatus Margulisiibacteriota bacterium]